MRLRLDVALSGPEVRVSGEFLNVLQRATDRRNVSGSVGDERALTAVAWVSRPAVKDAGLLTRSDGRTEREPARRAWGTGHRRKASSAWYKPYMR
jgi:hypothetical protein